MGCSRKLICKNAKLLQKWLDDIDILIYLAHNEGKSVMDERFIKTLKAKIYKN